MATTTKIEIVNSLTQKFENSLAIYFTCYTGMNVLQATKLRKNFRENGIDYLVSKNTLTRIAAKNAGFEDKLDDFMSGQVGIAYSSQDPISPARVIRNFKKENKDSLKVLGLVFEGNVFSANKFDELASLPGREELLAKFVGSIGQPMGKLVGTLGGAMSKLVGTLSSLKENKS